MGVYETKGTLKELCGDAVLRIALISQLRRSCYDYRCAFISAIISGRMVTILTKAFK
jgi:hypothetical protein